MRTLAQLLFASFRLQQAIDGGSTNAQQFLFGKRRQAQLAELLELGD
jgi:hypothetical protein